jgi:nucleoside phosphorylase
MSRVPAALTEPPEAACASLVHFILREDDPRRKDLLIRDLVAKATLVPPGLRRRWHANVMDSFATNPPHPDNLMVRAPAKEPKQVDIVIAAVLEVERRAILTVFDIEPDDPDGYKTYHGRRYYEAAFTDKRGQPRSVVITSLIRALNVRAAVSAMEIRQQYEASAYFLVGMAAGLRDRVSVGDVVVPESVFFYEPGRSTPDEFQPRPQHLNVDELLLRGLSHYNPRYSSSYYPRLDCLVAATPENERPSDLPNPWRPSYRGANAILISGEQVIQDGSLPETRARFDERIVAGDQEGYGVAEAMRGVRWAIFRGISDYGERNKPKAWQFVATLAAALAVQEFLETQYESADAEEF